MSNTKTDLRVIKTRKGLREAFVELSLTKRIEDMKISEITTLAEIARKTFYLHYKDVMELADDVCDTTLEQITSRFTGELTADIDVIYTFLDGADKALYHLLTAVGYESFQRRFWHAVFTDKAFDKYLDDPRFGSIAEGYLYSIVSIYKAYHDSLIKTMDVHQLAVHAANLLLNGISGE